MTVRAVVLGLALGVFVCAVTYFNNAVIRQPELISHHFPLGIFGAVVVLVLAINPAMRLLGSELPLRPGEVAVVTALSLAACGWPGFSYFSSFIPNTAMPNHWQRSATSWQATGVMSYVPGGSGALAQGHVGDWPGLVALLVAGRADQGPAIGRALWDRLPPETQRNLIDAGAGSGLDPTRRTAALWAINHAMADPALFPADVLAAAELPPHEADLRRRREVETLSPAEALRLNRAVLAAAYPDVILPRPPGSGVLLAGGEPGPEVDWVAQGPPTRGAVSLGAVPWEAWWPTLRLWGGLGLLLAGAALCLTLIVHPQWAHRELLPYPIAQFVRDVSEREPGAGLPRIARNPVFWYAVGAMLALHLVNGLHAWFDFLPSIPLQYNFWALKQLFPDAARAEGAWYVFAPRLYFTVIAFAFYLSTPVSLSVGLSAFAYLALTVVLLRSGVSLGGSAFLDADRGAVLRFGAFIGAALIILYTGRRYYFNILQSAVGLARQPGTPRYGVAAAYGLMVTAAASVALLRSTGLGWALAACFVLLALLTFLVLTRIVCETGLFFVQAWWMPVGILTALLGMEAIGPTGYIVLALASTLIVGDPRTLLMPYLANALRIGEQDRTAGPGRLSPWLVVMLAVGFVVAGAATFGLVHNYGAMGVGQWAYETMPKMPFDLLAARLSDMSAQGTLATAMQKPAGLQWSAISLDTDLLPWLLLGMGLLLVTAAARLRLAWWPLHPVLFLIWGTMPSSRLATSFLIGWAIKTSVVRLAGAKGHAAVKPLAVGVIAGELLAAVLWLVVGAIYFAVTRQMPQAYAVLP